MAASEVFTQTSHEPYIRHHYKMVYEDGHTSVFDNYEDAQLFWFHHNGQFLSHIEVLDIKEPKKKKGFR